MSFVILLDEVQQPEVQFGDKCFYRLSSRFNLNRYYRLVRYQTDEAAGPVPNRT